MVSRNSLLGRRRSPTPEVPEGVTVTKLKPDYKFEMISAITDVFLADGKQWYDELSDDQLFEYSEALWDFHTDLRDEHSRRVMARAGQAR